MNKIVFWDVDTQCDFMHSDGRLYVPEAEQIIDNLRTLTNHAHRYGVRVMASADDHRSQDPEISEQPDYEQTYPPHCMRGTQGQEKIAETALIDPLVIEPLPMAREELKQLVLEHRGDILFHKHEFDVFANPNVDTVLDVINPEIIVLYGVALDVCNRYAIEGLLRRRPGTSLHLVTDATKPIVRENAERLIERWLERGVKLITTAQALAMCDAERARGQRSA